MKVIVVCLFLFLLNGSACAQKKLEIPVSKENNKELLIERIGYTLSFNREHNIPNWVAWTLDDKKLIERVSRKGYNFRPDPEIDKKDAVVTQDYANSGYDRGHMCPAGDNRWSGEAMKESFYMTNICPQHPNLNDGDWHELEQACRRWAEKDKLYIVCGPILYKKALNPPIGKEYKNTAGNRPLDSYVNSIDQVERITGLDFFSALPDDVENKIEKEYDLKYWR